MGLGDPIEIQFLIERGYVRKKCPKCGEYFWTLDPDRETCGEAPCEPYSFIGKGTSDKSLEEVREDFLSFMESKGHTRIGRYPVIARWRDDLFLTSASIVDFQPFITAGLVPPPANPLTISQPCIRLKDVDKVGPTMGRHLTIFEMMAHHAFNTKERFVYWKERTVELFHEYATEVLGIPEEEIIYKESIWEGGGNAGPDLEPIVRGLEIATLVFMEYKEENGKYVPMDTKVVDTGYGLERITWLLRGDPTGFHAVYGDLVDTFRSELGVELVDEVLLSRYSEVSSILRELERGRKVNALRGKISEMLDMEQSYLEEKIAPLEKVFALLDHTKTIAFMLADGLVPSNVNEGYLGRLLIRRSLKLLKLLGVEMNLSELVARQVNYWSSKGFPELKEVLDRIVEIVDIEQARYEEILRKGEKIVRGIVKNKRKLDLEDLITLYDSHGVPPELVQTVAGKLGVNVEVPDNFYELIAGRHETRKPEAPRLPSFIDELDRYGPTRLLYYQDPYLMEFDATVVGHVDGMVLLDRTAFYPEGGGQPSDVGTLSWSGGRAEVVSVEKYKGRVLHRLNGPLPPVGTKVHGRVDEGRRLSRMRHHTATHVILEAARRVLGPHVWQWGAQKGDEESRLDITHYKSITPEELKYIELLANETVMRNLPVNTFWLLRTDAEKRYGFVLYQGGVVPDPVLRIVEIHGYNVQACGGTHVTRTGDIGPIKIWRARRIQDGVIRLEFSAGVPAARRLIDAHLKLKEIAQSLGVSEEDVDKAFRAAMEELKELRREVRRHSREIEEAKIKEALKGFEEVGGYRVSHVQLTYVTLDEGVKLVDKLVGGEERIVVMTRPSGEKVEVALLVNGYDLVAGDLVKEATKSVGGGGGGSQRLGRGSIPSEKLESFLEVIRARLGGN
ncbi:MAG: alanine--tRNA ligase [Candidatus Korarchaeota archaeon]|nr:alanine--tRNA ligase [Candidatus Korarchaeota archaeon]